MLSAGISRSKSVLFPTRNFNAARVNKRSVSRIARLSSSYAFSHFLVNKLRINPLNQILQSYNPILISKNLDLKRPLY